jgi:uncharacterized protein YggE
MSSQPRTVGVHGEGRVSVEPDLAYLVVGIETAGADLARAQRENATGMAAVLDRLRALGIAPGDLRTSGYNVQQGYDHREQRPTGFQVSNTVGAIVRDLARLGDVIDAAVAAGANRIHSVRFDRADKTDAIRRAREAAVADARDKAAQLARLGGLRLGAPLTIVEDGGVGTPTGAEYDSPPFLARARQTAAATPIAAGEAAIRLVVWITYELGAADETAER